MVHVPSPPPVRSGDGGGGVEVFQTHWDCHQPISVYGQIPLYQWVYISVYPAILMRTSSLHPSRRSRARTPTAEGSGRCSSSNKLKHKDADIFEHGLNLLNWFLPVATNFFLLLSFFKPTVWHKFSVTLTHSHCILFHPAYSWRVTTTPSWVF